jgi:hypothetical protein
LRPLRFRHRWLYARGCRILPLKILLHQRRHNHIIHSFELQGLFIANKCSYCLNCYGLTKLAQSPPRDAPDLALQGEQLAESMASFRELNAGVNITGTGTVCVRAIHHHRAAEHLHNM